MSAYLKNYWLSNTLVYGVVIDEEWNIIVNYFSSVYRLSVMSISRSVIRDTTIVIFDLTNAGRGQIA